MLSSEVSPAEDKLTRLSDAAGPGTVRIKLDHDGLVPFDNVVLGDPIHMLLDPRETLCR